MAKTVSQFASEIADREAIRDCIARYARAIDRIDEALLRSIYWEDAENDAVVHQASAPEFIAFILPLMRTIDRTAHMLGAPLIDVGTAGSHAVAETYVLALTRAADEGGEMHDNYTGGRYIDRFEKRDDEWRIKHRKLVIDWFREMPDATDWSNGFRGFPAKPGGRMPDDEIYRELAES